MLKKESVIEAVNQMPGDEVNVEALVETLRLLQKLQKAEEDIVAGRVYTTDDLRQIVGKP